MACYIPLTSHTNQSEGMMTLILLGLLIGMVALLWMLVLAIIHEDRQQKTHRKCTGHW